MLPLLERPPMPIWSTLRFCVVFLSAMIAMHTTQLLASPLAIIPWTRRKFYWPFIDLTKAQYGYLLVWITQHFAPTSFLCTFDENVRVEDLVKLDGGEGQWLNLPQHSVLMSNHQIYTDWAYIWSLLYLAEIPNSIIIILKDSLRWAPIVGPAMQLFRFVFLARSWIADQKVLGKTLAKMGTRLERSGDPLTLLIFPEGTVHSANERGKSAKFAEKTGIEDLKNCLLPRSTGLQFCLRALSPRLPSLELIDLTIGYEGVPAGGHGQEYYTLFSTFGRNQPPPGIHLHYRSLPVNDVPIGAVSGTSTSSTSPTESTPEEKADFSAWLLNRWREKDALLDHFYATGSFSGAKNASKREAVRLRLELQAWDQVKLFALMLPGAFVCLCVFKVFGTLLGY